MCSNYTSPKNFRQIEEAIGVSVNNQFKEFEWGKEIRFSTRAPVIEKAGDGYAVVGKIFPVSAMPNSRLSGIGNQSDAGKDDEDSEHSQIKRIYEMPRWKEGFKTHPLLVPMSSFVEFAYWGKEAGSAQEFTLPTEDLLFCAGISIKPFTPKGNQNDGFALLTHTATDEMLKFHHRLIVILKAHAALAYLDEMSSEERFNYLIKNRYTGKLAHSKVRNMEKGWEKRIDVQEHKKDLELTYRQKLEKEKVEG